MRPNFWSHKSSIHAWATGCFSVSLRSWAYSSTLLSTNTHVPFGIDLLPRGQRRAHRDRPGCHRLPSLVGLPVGVLLLHLLAEQIAEHLRQAGVVSGSPDSGPLRDLFVERDRYVAHVHEPSVPRSSCQSGAGR